ncbi:MAG TPA: MarR family transcriptional regulator [Candidatus Yaniella excrementigallinarum]|nr:MarR family transcriptional regulator [Candidatus Yaniella excrementigallinarum]
MTNPADHTTVSPQVAAGQSPLGGQLFYLLDQVTHELHTAMHTVLATENLNIRQYATLALVAGKHTVTQHNLSKVLDLDPSQVVSLVKGLVDRNLLTRQTLETDRRAKVLNITEDGARLYTRVETQIRQVEEAVTASLSPRDRKILAALLERVLPLT